ncbi:hypothetical protein A5819_002258 [Enterococcus sp. 7E2_DIV0204]|uniref:Lipoprotein n=1 Tax=Candidatus Enterococcus lemimoniae TaxID=1834167 RepID=A0ABZ2T965_9ENTE|nr:hypothetical protein [Enterococcus sp. 7E2_DIV0204]OTN89760.1 hypothetical protein A5819_002258 [Enterococcus sp. 7E2_DIV0204]
MYFNKKRKFFFVLWTLLIGLVISGCSTSNQENKTVTSETTISESVKKEVKKINEKADEILSEKDNDKKLSDLKVFIEEVKDYSKVDKKEKDVTKAYNDSKNKIISELKKEDKKNLETIKVEALKTEKSELLSTKVGNLEELRDWMNKENGIIYSENETKELIREIDRLIEAYKDQLKKISIAEKAAAEQAAAEKAAAEQAAAEKAGAEQAAAEKAAVEQAAAEKAVAEQANSNSTGYTKDYRGRWHRPNGQYASKTEIAAAGLSW